MAGDDFDICVIGAGSGGLSVAYAASHMGQKVALIEGHRMGGDCLNFGCVPSKALLAAGHAAQAMRDAGRFGIAPVEPQVDFAAVNAHVRGVIAAIEPHDSAPRYEGFGVDVIMGHARFTGPATVEAAGRTIRARRFVVATGSRAVLPPIPGLADVPAMTNETLFELTERPGHLLIIGGGPIGCEMAQAHRQLGCRVTVLDMGPILPKDDPELAGIVRARLLDEGVVLLEKVAVQSVSGTAGAITIAYEEHGQARTVTGSHLLVATGRRAAIDDLGLDAAGIEHDRSGIRVDAHLRTTNRKVYAVGDCAGPYQFTHLASYHAGIVIRNMLLKLPARVDLKAFPWVTYTHPELANVGLTEEQARRQHGEVTVLRFPFAEVDRAIAERDTRGLIKVVTTKRGRILGAAIVGPRAGDLLQPWTLAISRGLKIGAMAGAVSPYPSFVEIGKRAAGSYFSSRLFGAGMRRLVRFLALFG